MQALGKHAKAFPAPLAAQRREVEEELVARISGDKHRPLEPLRLQAHRPVPLEQFEPVFDDVFTGRKSDRDRERREQSKLRHQYKQELKGAMRELRKDGRFLAKKKFEEQAERDQQRLAKVKEIHSLLSSQQGEANELERIKDKLNRKRKKKSS